MQFNIGDTVLVVMDLCDVNSVIEGKILTINNKDFSSAVIQHNGMQEPCHHYLANVWPVSCKEDLLHVIATRHMLKEAYDDSISLVMQLRNQLNTQ